MARWTGRCWVRGLVLLRWGSVRVPLLTGLVQSEGGAASAVGGQVAPPVRSGQEQNREAGGQLLIGHVGAAAVPGLSSWAWPVPGGSLWVLPRHLPAPCLPPLALCAASLGVEGLPQVAVSSCLRHIHFPVLKRRRVPGAVVTGVCPWRGREITVFSVTKREICSGVRDYLSKY